MTSLLMAEVVVRRDSKDILHNKGKSKIVQYRTHNIVCSDRAAMTPEQNIHVFMNILENIRMLRLIV